MTALSLSRSASVFTAGVDLREYATNAIIATTTTTTSKHIPMPIFVRDMVGSGCITDANIGELLIVYVIN